MSSENEGDEKSPLLPLSSSNDKCEHSPEYGDVRGANYGNASRKTTTRARSYPARHGETSTENPLELEVEDIVSQSNMETEDRKRVTLLSILWAYRKTIMLIATPLLSLPLLIIIGDGPAKGAFVIIVMAVYWIFEILPLAVTSLLPVILYPLLGIQDSDDVCRNYLKDTNFLFVGGLIVAVAVEHWDVHRRFALGVLLLMGSKLRWLMLGFMIVTAFLSMWISNTATTAMMIPIAHSVVMQLLEQRKENKRKREAEEAEEEEKVDSSETEELTNEKGTSTNETSFNGGIVNQTFEADEDKKYLEAQDETAEVENVEKAEEAKVEARIDLDMMTAEEKKLCKALLLCVPYAANIGGTATLTGTGPNVVMSGIVDELYGTEAGVTFASWLIFSIPGTVINLLLCWLWLQVLFVGFGFGEKKLDEREKRLEREEERSARNVIKLEYKKLGPWTWVQVSVLCHFIHVVHAFLWLFRNPTNTKWGQVSVLCHFIVLAFLWLFRNPTFIPGFAGWSGLFPIPDYISDATAAIIIAVALFIFPAYPPWFLRCFRVFRKENDEEPESRDALLDWKTTQRMLPWNIILLLGGGFALASGTEASGLSQWLADQFLILDFLPPWVLVLIITIIICLFTEFTSNVATATIFLPILAALAESICINPLYIMLPATIACSYAFMLPVATPPNAIAFAYGSLSVPDMMRAGALMNVIGIIVVNVLINSMGIVVFDVFNYPTWAGNTDVCLASTANATMSNVYTTANQTCVCY